MGFPGGGGIEPPVSFFSRLAHGSSSGSRGQGRPAPSACSRGERCLQRQTARSSLRLRGRSTARSAPSSASLRATTNQFHLANTPYTAFNLQFPQQECTDHSPGPLQPGPAAPALVTLDLEVPPATFPAPVFDAPLPAAPPVLPAALAPALAEQVVRATLPSLMNLVVTNPSFTAAITAEVRRTTSRVAETVLFKEEVLLLPALCTTLEAAAAETPKGMDMAEDATSNLGCDSTDSENLLKFE